jgi:hypothetical protein
MDLRRLVDRIQIWHCASSLSFFDFDILEWPQRHQELPAPLPAEQRFHYSARFPELRPHKTKPATKCRACTIAGHFAKLFEIKSGLYFRRRALCEHPLDFDIVPFTVADSANPSGSYGGVIKDGSRVSGGTIDGGEDPGPVGGVYVGMFN